MDEEEAQWKVLGHMCEGLELFLRVSHTRTCYPGISSHGIVEGCDDENPIPIMFCPWCGAFLGRTTPESLPSYEWGEYEEAVAKYGKP